MARFGRFYKLTGAGRIYGKKVLPTMRWATPQRYVETCIWKRIYRFIFSGK